MCRRPCPCAEWLVAVLIVVVVFVVAAPFVVLAFLILAKTRIQSGEKLFSRRWGVMCVLSLPRCFVLACCPPARSLASCHSSLRASCRFDPYRSEIFFW